MPCASEPKRSLDADRSGAASGRDRSSVSAARRGSAARERPDLCHQVEIVVARRGVGADAHRDAGIEQRGDAGGGLSR